MDPFRQAIRARLKALDWSYYALVQRCPDVPASCIYEYLAGQCSTNSAHLASMMRQLGLRLVVPPPPKPRRPAKAKR